MKHSRFWVHDIQFPEDKDHILYFFYILQRILPAQTSLLEKLTSHTQKRGSPRY